MPNPILILGASGTLGGAIAQRLFNDGQTVILHAHKNSKPLKSLSKSCGDGDIVTTDLTDEEQVTSLFHGIEKSSGGLGGIVFSVACNFPHKLTHRTPWSVFQNQINTQLKAAHLCLSAAYPLLKKTSQKEPARVLIISTEYVMGMPPVKVAPYVSAKAALTAYAKVIAQEWLGQNIRVHIMAPGMVISNLTADLPQMYLDQVASQMPEKCLTSAGDVADVASFLMTPGADSLYGTVIPVTRSERRSL